MRINGNQRVADVNDLHPPVLKTVAAQEKTARLENSKYFAQDFVLQFWGRNVVEHGERNRARELRVSEGHDSRVALHNAHISSVKASAERCGQFRINFQCG
jgi:hypothetical protein